MSNVRCCNMRARKWTDRNTAKGFVVLTRRWVVERTFAWLNRNRRLAKDFEATIASATTWFYVASVNVPAARRPMSLQGTSRSRGRLLPSLIVHKHTRSGAAIRAEQNVQAEVRIGSTAGEINQDVAACRASCSNVPH